MNNPLTEDSLARIEGVLEHGASQHYTEDSLRHVIESHRTLQQRLTVLEEALQATGESFHGLSDAPAHQASALFPGRLHESIPLCDHYVCVRVRQALSYTEGTERGE